MPIDDLLAASTVGASTLTGDRIVATAAVVMALAAAIAGGLALARSTGRGDSRTGKRGTTIALVTGATGMVVGGLVVATADGGPGTGNGIVGGFAALALGLIAVVLSGLALARAYRRTTTMER
ncbi:DUF6223 family protein [Actinoplanes sp. NPDC051475]|uniref:DUF6223 family protein n=1 Tax=Actinoplanes sp. NPDC051475 TaxID=3157225 RepID=UPI00344C4452